MNISEIIKKNNIKFKEKKFKRLSYFEFENETLLVLINSSKNIFKINRKEFEEIESILLNYDFCLLDTTTEQLYYMKIIEPNNFIRKAFDSTTKNEIYFGKEILKNKITQQELIKKIKMIGVKYYE